MTESLSPHEREARVAQFKKEANEKLVSLLKPGLPIAEIAKLLDAEDLITAQPPERGKKPVYKFDVQAFIQREIHRGTFLLLPDSFEKLATIVLPPDEGGVIQRGSGEGLEEKKLIPRSHYLVEVLTELKQPYQIVSGTNTPNMVRGESYQAFIIPGLKKLVLVNNEEGNATFIISIEDKEDPQHYYQLTKEQLKDLNEPKVVTIQYPGDSDQWKVKIKFALTQPVQPKIKTESISREKAPADWKHLFALSKDFGATRQAVAKIIDAYKTEHPDWCKKYYDNRNREVEFFSPALAEKIQKDLAGQVKRAPEGWRTKLALGSEFDVDDKTFSRIADRYRQKNPGYFRTYLNSMNRSIEFYSPELVHIITAELQGTVEAPEGWKTVHALEKLLKTSTYSVEKILEPFRASDPTQFKKYKEPVGSTVREHISPELITKVQLEFFKHDNAPPGWQIASDVAADLRANRKTIANKLKTIIATHPEWRQSFRAPDNRVLEFYHPDAIQILKEEMKIQG